MFRTPNMDVPLPLLYPDVRSFVHKWGCENGITTPFRGLIRRVGCTDGTFQIELRRIHIHAPNHSCTPVSYIIQV